MHPCIMLGSYVLDEDRLPADEFKLRNDVLRRRMAEAGLDAVLVYGDAREHGALAYLTNFIPRMRWALALLPREGEPRLLCSMSSRDVPAMRSMTWIGDVCSGWEWKWFGDWIGRAREAGIRNFGRIGFDLIPPALHATILDDLGTDTRLTEATGLLGDALLTRRPREMQLMRTAAGIAGKAAAEFVRGVERGTPFETAMLDAERGARMSTAQDVRTLVSFDGGATLEPFRGEFTDAGPRAVGYFAVKYMGYWADALITVGAGPDETAAVTAALNAMTEALRPGAPLAGLAAAAGSQLQGHPPHAALQGSFGRAIGLSPAAGPEISAATDPEATVVPGGVYSLQAGTAGPQRGCLGSVLVRATADGPEILLSSLPA